MNTSPQQSQEGVPSSSGVFILRVQKITVLFKTVFFEAIQGHPKAHQQSQIGADWKGRKFAGKRTKVSNCSDRFR